MINICWSSHGHTANSPSLSPLLLEICRQQRNQPGDQGHGHDGPVSLHPRGRVAVFRVAITDAACGAEPLLLLLALVLVHVVGGAVSHEHPLPVLRHAVELHTGLLAILLVAARRSILVQNVFDVVGQGAEPLYAAVMARNISTRERAHHEHDEEKGGVGGHGREVGHGQGSHPPSILVSLFVSFFLYPPLTVSASLLEIDVCVSV